MDSLTGDSFSNTSNLRGAGDDLLEDSSGFSTYMTGDNLASRVKVSGKGDDVLINRTGPGRSQLVGDHLNDTGSVTGGRGNDRIRSGEGNDTLIGDSIWVKGSPGGGRDRLSAGAGDDSLTGGPKRDRCGGDGGTDLAFQCEVLRGIP
jgi:Ca2+-binding RTX toxin-like protein